MQFNAATNYTIFVETVRNELNLLYVYYELIVGGGVGQCIIYNVLTILFTSIRWLKHSKLTLMHSNYGLEKKHAVDLAHFNTNEKSQLVKAEFMAMNAVLG